jgi:sugar O-acyltransferase (sialic acid O-acetyltransferase NeuD family)
LANVILWGATGQAKVVRPILTTAGHRIIAIFDNDAKRSSPFSDVPFFGDWREFRAWQKHVPRCSFVVCIGGTRGSERAKISRDLEDLGFEAITAVHDRAWIAETATLGPGCQVLALAGIGEYSMLGAFCIVNTNATVDHDCCLGSGVHVMPGATIAGEVQIGDYASIGSNATVLPRLSIGARAVVGAGAVVTHPVAQGATVVGCPARPFAEPR